MTSLAAFPQLRRTLTDVMEDELYHVAAPSQQASQSGVSYDNTSTSSAKLQHLLQHGLQHHAYNHSPTLTHSRLYRNTSALNSEELLTIPELEGISHNNLTSNPSNTSSLSKVNSHDMYYDVPEQLPTNFNDISSNSANANNANTNSTNNANANTISSIGQIFNEFGDPNLTTTNNSFFNTIGQHQSISAPHQPQFQHPRFHQHHPQPFDQSPNPQPAKLLKFNDDLTLDYFRDDEDDEGSKFVIFSNAVISPNLIPEDIEDEELSDYDDDFDDFEMNGTQLSSFGYLDDNNLKSEPHCDNGIAGNASADIESDVDKMSLASSDDDYDDDDIYSSNSSVIDDDLSPSFNIKKPLYSTQRKRSISNALVSSRTIRRDEKTNPIPVTNNSSNATPGSNVDNEHTCHLVNPSTNKPCEKKFSRPYDLIRHQETIHAERKKIFRCIVCNKLEGGLSKKTFSRGDALSRHVRVKHGLSGDEAADAVKYAKDHVEYMI